MMDRTREVTFHGKMFFPQAEIDMLVEDGKDEDGLEVKNENDAIYSLFHRYKREMFRDETYCKLYEGTLHS
mgnify:CR=1 FL=1